jgi:hypothetical protein
VTWSVAPGVERTVRTLVIVGFVVALGVWTPAIITSAYWLGLLINAMILGLSAVSIGFLAYQSGLMMFGVSALTGGATYIYAIAITWFGLKALPASALTLAVATILFPLVGRPDCPGAALAFRDADACARATSPLGRAHHRLSPRHGRR